MIGKRGSCLLAISLLVLSALPVPAQGDRVTRASSLSRSESDLRIGPPSPVRIPRPPTYPAVGFNGMVHAAGVIFSGTVRRIDRRPATDEQALETVAITFHVDTGLRGTRGGQDVTVAEWIGLWSNGQRYRVGEKVLLFFYPRSKLGLTSWVGGPLGRFNVSASGYVFPTRQQYSAFRSDPVLGGKLRLRISDFALAVSEASGKE